MDEAARPLVMSLDGRRFTYEVSVDVLDVGVGRHVVVDDDGSGGRIGYVTAVGLDPANRRLVRVEGRILENPGEPVVDGSVRVAGEEDISAWLLGARPPRAHLEVGMLSTAPAVRLAFDAGGFDRHTFMCGQSGSGKTYALGTVLERLLAETSLRVVVLDPNSDFVRLGQLRGDVDPAAAARYAAVPDGIDVRRASSAGGNRLHVRFRDFDSDERAAVLHLDPIDDRDEYAVLTEALEDTVVGGSVAETVERMKDSPDPLHSLGVRAQNLGIDRWEVWSGDDPDALQELVGPGGPRCLVVDLGSLGTRGEQTVAAEAVLASLWRGRAAREPVLIVIDEAHNICPAEPEDRLTGLATEHAVRIAGEGRKFGLVLLVATQRPQKVHENVISQCDNLILMRMNSRSDLALLAETFSFVPGTLLDLATDFGQGESVVAGKIVPSPALGRFGPRWTEEGGSDVPSTWAAPRA